MIATINGNNWNIVFVDSNSYHLQRSDGSITLGVTDKNENSVYLSDALRGRLLETVLSHELCHVACFEYNVILTLDVEETVANFLALYGREIIDIADRILSEFAISRA